jgi:two-component system sensor histidine kinase/response regulator
MSEKNCQNTLSLIANMATSLHSPERTQWPDEAQETKPERDPEAFQCKVLAVDDRRENLAVIAEILSKLGADVVLASSGRDALAMLKEDVFAVMLLDVSMPEMDGYEVARHMRESGSHVPVILLTGVDRDERCLLKGYDAGVVDFLFKPISPTVVRHKVQVFLNLFNERKAVELANRKLVALQQVLITRRIEAERDSREIALQKAELEYRNQELMHRNRELDSFAHVVSHDLRQPVQSILDYLDLIAIEAGPSPDSNIQRWIGSCLRLGQSMHGLISDVLEYATLGTQTITMQPTDSNAALANAMERLMAAVKESGACVTCEPLPRVLGSEKLLTRVFQNLISNAIKYRGEEPATIQVRAEWDPRRKNWLFRVIDNGRGIDPNDGARIFEMFARTKDSQDIPGTGIGLAICKRIVEAHGGRIWVTSKLKQGSEFCFALTGENSLPENPRDLCQTQDS